MPLLCISLLALLLLPLCLSCDRPPKDVINDYRAIVHTHLHNTREAIETLLRNSSCSGFSHRLPNCSDDRDVVGTLHNLSCKMKRSRLPHTEKLAESVLNSLWCKCPETTTRGPGVKTRHTTRKKRDENGRRIETRKRCRVMAMLSTMTECYAKLNLNTVSDT